MIHLLHIYYEDDTGDNGASEAANSGNTNDEESNKSEEQTQQDPDDDFDWTEIENEVAQNYGDITTDKGGPDVATQQYAESIKDGTADYDQDTAQSFGRGGSYSISDQGNIYSNDDVVVDSSGNPVTDNNGNYIYSGTSWSESNPNSSSEDIYGSKAQGEREIANEQLQQQINEKANNATKLDSNVNDLANQAAQSNLQPTTGQTNRVSTAIDEDEKAHLANRQVYDEDELALFNNAKDLNAPVMDFSNNNGRGYGNAEIARDNNGVAQYGSVDTNGKSYSKNDYYSPEEANNELGYEAYATNAHKGNSSNPVTSAWNNIKDSVADLGGKITDSLYNLNQSLGGRDKSGQTKADEIREAKDNKSTTALTSRYNDLAKKSSEGKLTSKEEKELNALESRYGTNLQDLNSDKYQSSTQTSGGRLSNIADYLGEKAIASPIEKVNDWLGGSDKYGLNSRGQFVDRNGDGRISLGERAQNIGSNIYNAAKDKLNDITNPFQREEELWNEGKQTRSNASGDFWQNVLGYGKQAGAILSGIGKEALTAAVNPGQAIMDIGMYGANKLGNKVLSEAERHSIEDLASSKSSPSTQSFADTNSTDTSDDDSYTNAIVESLKKPKVVANASSKISNQIKQSLPTGKYDTIVSQHRQLNQDKIKNHKGTISDERLKSFVIATYTNPAIAQRYGKMLMLSGLTNNDIQTRRRR